MPVYQEIIDLCNSIGPGCGLSQWCVDLAEEIPFMCEDGLKQPHLTTKEGRSYVWGYQHDLNTLMEAANFKAKQDRDFLKLLQKQLNEWGKLLDSRFFADGPPRPDTAIRQQLSKHA